MKILAVVLIAIATMLGARSEALPSWFEGPPWNQIPSRFHLFLYFDWNNNVGAYRSNPVSIEDRTPRDVYYFEVPEASLYSLMGSHLESKFAEGDGAVQSLIKVQDREGINFYRIYTLDPTLDCFQEIRKRGFNYYGGFKGVKLQSNSSYFVWNPEVPDDAPFVVKFSYDTGSNSISHSFNAIRNSEYTEQSLQRQPKPKIAYLPEVYTAGWQGEHPYSFVVRSLKPVGYLAQSGDVLAPVHGVLGSPELLAELAAAAHTTVRGWIIDEYVAKYAEFLAQMHYVHGIHPESHTQNMNMYVNFETGKIGALIHKDSSHDRMDVNARLTSGHDTAPLSSTNHVMAIANFGEPRWNQELDLNHAGFQFAAVEVKGLLDVATGIYDQIEVSKKFLVSYVKEVEAITGLKIPLKKDLKLAFRKLNGPADEIQEYRYLSAGDLPLMLAKAIEHIHRFVANQSQKFLQGGTQKFDQATAFAEVTRKLEEQKYIRFAKEEPTIKDRFYFDGKKIIVKKRFTGRIIGYAYDFDEGEMARRLNKAKDAICPTMLMDL